MFGGNFAFEKAKGYYVVAMGLLAGTGNTAPSLVNVLEDRRKVATAAKLTVIHASATTGKVDVYLTPTDDISSATPALAGVDFKQFATGVEVAEGTYSVTVTPEGNKAVEAIKVSNLQIDKGKLYGIVALDGNGGIGNLQVNTLDF
ncbi:hypothetical protein CS022_05130 [Veronia nyctiphanis]|uniref:DUF4397 domain-containing protein n=1 Tax=Veronia nyctiphanis TaxID=1278244 RepID=A0A4Q0YS71_9GAMM|nr:hypothetical protein CS022_05130 [Veronia nyctiphanis]